MTRWGLEKIVELKDLHVVVTPMVKIGIIPIFEGARITWLARLAQWGLRDLMPVTVDTLLAADQRVSLEDAKRLVAETEEVVAILNCLYPEAVPEIEPQIREVLDNDAWHMNAGCGSVG